jgi:putative flippase GtrA
LRLPHFALTEIGGLAVDLVVTCLLIFYLGVDPLAARLPGAATGLATSWRLNRSYSEASARLNSFLTNAVTLTSRIVSVGLFALLQWRNPLVQPLVPLAFSALAAFVLALYGYWRLQKQRQDQD